MDIKQNILDAVNEWLTPSFDTETQEAVKALIAGSPTELEESFYKNRQISAVSFYRNGNKIDKSLTYFADGVLQSSTEYFDDQSPAPK